MCLSYRNSEIYNHEEVKAQHLPGVRIVKDSKSDSAIIGHLYQVRRLALGSSPQTCCYKLSSRPSCAGALLLQCRLSAHVEGSRSGTVYVELAKSSCSCMQAAVGAGLRTARGRKSS